MNVMVDITKRYKTYDGQFVTFLSDKGHSDYPIIGYIENECCPTCWTARGTIYGEVRDSKDLVEVKEPKTYTCWVNFYLNNDGTVYTQSWKTKETADAYAAYLENRIGKAVQVNLVVEE